MTRHLAHTLPSRSKSELLRSLVLCTVLGAPLTALAQGPQPGEAPRLEPRIFQGEVERARTPRQIREIRRQGLRIFSTPFNRLDGLGDGAFDPAEDTTAFGNRPRLQNLDTPFLRFNGLDAQTCLECHATLSTTEIPATPGIGGTGGISSSPMPGVTLVDGRELDGNGIAEINGRFLNPPINFGGGGISLLGKEMTADLQALKRRAQSAPGIAVRLETKGVDFGTLVCRADGSCDTGGVEGIDDDLVVRPFGRNGEFTTTRAFDLGAMMFHHGIQPVEVVGEGVDADGDGVGDELTVGEMSALSMFLEGLAPPEMRPSRLTGAARTGAYLFEDIGCADCHIPNLTTTSPILTFSFPEVPTDPSANVYQALDLRRHGFSRASRGSGVDVPLFADLKRHDMGDRLAEDIDSPLARTFTTARLWGVADTAPYLHDGRATTLSEAILYHAGEGEAARNAFDALSGADRNAILSFLRTLRNPRDPNRDLLGLR